MKSISIFLFLILVSCTERTKNQNIDSYLEIHENKIHYKINGHGQELVMVHGGYLDLDMWQAQVDAFENERKIIRFSDLGHGKTISNDHSIFGYEIIEKLTDATDKNPITLVGLSWGAMICVDFVLNNPKKVDKLILVSPGLNGWKYFQDTISGNNNALRQVAIRNKDIKRAAELFHQNWVVGPRRNKADLESEFYYWSLDLIKTNMKKHWGENWSKLDSISAIERLNKINVPTYIIIGNQDGMDIQLIAEKYDRNVPDSKKIILENVAHLLNIENSEAFNNLLYEILNER